MDNGLPQWLSSQESACNAGAARDAESIPGLERSPGGGNGNSLQYSCLENPMDRGVRRVTKTWTRLKWLSMHLACMTIQNVNIRENWNWVRDIWEHCNSPVSPRYSKVKVYFKQKIEKKLINKKVAGPTLQMKTKYRLRDSKLKHQLFVYNIEDYKLSFLYKLDTPLHRYWKPFIIQSWEKLY